MNGPASTLSTRYEDHDTKLKNLIHRTLQSSSKTQDNLYKKIEQANKLTTITEKTPPIINTPMTVERITQPKAAHGMPEEDLTALKTRNLDFSIQFGEGPDRLLRAFDHINERFAGFNHNLKIETAFATATLAKALGSETIVVVDYLETLSKVFKTTEQEVGTAQFFNTFAGRTALLATRVNLAPEKMQENLNIAAPVATAAGIVPAEIMTVTAFGSAHMPGTEAGSAYTSILENSGTAGSLLKLNFSNEQGGVASITTMLDGLQAKYGEVVDAAERDELSKAFGSEKAATLLEHLITHSTRFKTTLMEVQQVDSLGPAIEVANAMIDAWSKIDSSVKAVWFSLGVYLAPQLAVVADAVAALATVVKTILERFPLLGKAITFTALAISVLAVAMTALKVICLTYLAVQALMAAAWGLLTKLVTFNYLASLKSIAVKALHIVSLTALAVVLGTCAAVNAACTAAAWLLNIALYANPISPMVAAVIAYIAILAAAIYYWDEWTTALLESEAFKTVAAWFESLSAWFNSMGGWSGLASAAWDSIVAVFNQSLNALIEMLNSIPGVNIETRFGALPEPPGQEQLSAVDRASASISAATPSLITTADANKVPAGGLLNSIQNSTQQNRGTHVEKVEIHTSKPMTSHDLQGLLEMTG
ncbi:hypothetical protein RAM80_08305 [Pseudomonas sp. App30]|uniref:phage tail tape measure protein n=1 Tax=Pseudomonas sp. App30 TaxID=3068990 RepID=UPI003A80324C